MVIVMSFINNLIRLAKADPPPAELVIRDNQVGALAAHARGCTASLWDGRNLEDDIRQGRLKLLNIPVRVIGQHARIEGERGE